METRAFIATVLTHAASIARQNFGKVTAMTKSGDSNQVLTETDLAIGTYIIGQIEKQFPNDNIIDEEAGVVHKGGSRTWVVDPIDGTSNFANGLPQYGIMLGLLEEDVPHAGGVMLPYFDELYLAEKGKGASCNEHDIRVGSKTDLSDCLVAYGIDGHREDPDKTYKESTILAKIILSCRNMRTSNSAFDMMMAASGKYDAYINKTTKIWDNVVPHVIVTEAGGVYTDYYGFPIDYTNALNRTEENFTVLSASSAIHQQLSEITKQ